MGFWNETIYGNNFSLDWRDKIYETCNSEQYGVKNKIIPINKEIFSKNIDKLICDIESESNKESKSIAYQVLGATIINSGFDVDSIEGLREKIINASKEDCYSKESPARNNVIKNFVNLIKNYDCNNPVNIEEENLFQDIEDEDDETSKEFKLIFDILKGRKKKVKNNIEEKSSIKEFDDGYEAAATEEVEFIEDLIEFINKLKTVGILFDKIEQNISEKELPEPNLNRKAMSSEEVLKSLKKTQPKGRLDKGKDSLPG